MACPSSFTSISIAFPSEDLELIPRFCWIPGVSGPTPGQKSLWDGWALWVARALTFTPFTCPAHLSRSKLQTHALETPPEISFFIRKHVYRVRDIGVNSLTASWGRKTPHGTCSPSGPGPPDVAVEESGVATGGSALGGP